MLCKKLLALFVWCHCYQLVLNPLLQFLSLALRPGDELSSNQLASLYVAGSPITAAANQVALVPGHEMALHCKVAEFPELEFTWSRRRLYSGKDEQPLAQGPEEAMTESNDKITVTSNDIIIKSPTLADIGDYYCRPKQPPSVVDKEKMIRVRVRPYILDFEVVGHPSTFRSAIVEEGKSLRIPCNAVDDWSERSEMKLTWHMSKYEEDHMTEVTSGEDGIRIIQYNETSNELVIDRVTKDHRRYYKCLASNGITENEKVILIRVKDSYTVIWPTVGIFCELVILIGVICAVESRKVEPDLDNTNRDLKAIQM